MTNEVINVLFLFCFESLFLLLLNYFIEGEQIFTLKLFLVFLDLLSLFDLVEEEHKQTLTITEISKCLTQKIIIVF